MENTTLLFNDEIENIIDAMDLSQEAPVEEPQRQYWFMKKARQLVKEQSEKLGRPHCQYYYFWLSDECQRLRKISRNFGTHRLCRSSGRKRRFCDL